jgi:fumarate reductase subunit C
MSAPRPTAGAPGAATDAPPYARLYKPKIRLLWWLSRRTYTLFVLRELSSVFVAWSVVYLLLLVRAVGRGPAEYQRFLDWSANPGVIVLNVVTLAFVLYHAVTFVNLTPQAMVLKVRGRRVPGRLLAGSIYLSWLLVSAFLVWLVVG